MTTSKKQHKVVIVDDESMLRELVAAYLSYAGYEVHLARNGRDALEVVEQVQPSLVIMDWMMPEMNGFEACSHLRARPETAALPVLMMTAAHDPSLGQEAWDRGATDVLLKPFTLPALGARVEGLFQRGTVECSTEDQTETLAS